MTNQEIESKLKSLTENERKITRQIVELIKICLERKLWVERAFDSPAKWLIATYGYSEPAAYRRLDAARALIQVPELANKIESGEANLTTIAMVQSAFRQEQKRTGFAVTLERKLEVFTKIENATAAGTARVIAKEFKELTPARSETLRAIGESEWSLTITLTNEQKNLLTRAKEIHSLPTFATSIERMAREHVHRHDPIEREKRRATAQCDAVKKPEPMTGPHTQRQRDRTIAKADGQCEYIDHKSGRRCEQRSDLQADHITPRALGGTNDALRCLCGQHNRLMAERILGMERANAWRTTA